MKLLLSYFRDLFKPEFKPSEDDLIILEDNINSCINDTETIKRKENTTNETHLKLNLISIIYNETETLKTYERRNSVLIKESTAYYDLISESSEFRIQFLYILLDCINKDTVQRKTNYDRYFLYDLFNAILETKIDLTDEDFINFFQFKERIYFRSNISYQLLINKIFNYPIKKNISKALIDILKTDKKQNYYKTKRILTNYQYRNNEIPFFLLPDYFGKKTNTFLLNIEKDNAISLSKTLQFIILNETKNNKSHQQKTDSLVKKLGLNNFVNHSITLLETGANFKPKVKIYCHTLYSQEKRTCYKTYDRMESENIQLVLGLLKFLIKKSLTKNIPINILEVFIKRGYSFKDDELKLGKNSTQIGSLCISILGYNYNEQGIKKLKEIYSETKYKRVKKEIDVIFNNI